MVHGIGRYPEQLGERFRVLDAASPGLLDQLPGHEQTGGKVVGNSFYLVKLFLLIAAAEPGVNELPAGVVYDMLEFMG